MLDRLEVVDKVDMVCIGAKRIDEYEAEGFLLKGQGYVVLIIEKEKGDIEENILGAWMGRFDDIEEARNEMKDILYNLGRMNDRGFGCHEAPSILNFRKLKGQKSNAFLPKGPGNSTDS